MTITSEDLKKIRADFPILDSTVNGRKLIYLDNAATTQMPTQVIEKVADHYRFNNANIHRGIHTLSERSTAEYEDTRRIVAEFINAKSCDEVVFTHGTTESINMLALGLEYLLKEDAGVLVTDMEHHSNFLPWQRAARRSGALFDILFCDDGIVDLDYFGELLEESPKIVAFAHVTNLTGTVFPIKEMTQMAHEAGALVAIDGAQGIRHGVVDVQDIDCDFYSFSAHKIIGPSGVGVLYGKREALEMVNPLMLGGGMVDTVTYDGVIYDQLPARLEAGTPNISGVIGFGEALKYIDKIGRENIAGWESELLTHAEDVLSGMEGIRILGYPEERAGVLSFNIEGVHPYDAASLLDKMGVALRSGTHCAQPALNGLDENYALRLSPAFYNTLEEIDAACDAILKVKEMLL